jgi:hypothetical protein
MAGYPSAYSIASSGLTPLYLFSAASYIKPATSLSLSGRLSTFNQATNTYTRAAATTLPPDLTPVTFTPASVGAIGYITASFNKPAEVALSTAPDNDTSPGRSELNPGQSVTYYALAFDKFGNYIRQTPATWSLTINQGSANQWSLVPSADGMSAVLTALNGSAFSSFCTVNIAAPGLTPFSGGGGILT